jgi:CubicO group peptidase (beta-lactamase class C family)
MKRSALLLLSISFSVLGCARTAGPEYSNTTRSLLTLSLDEQLQVYRRIEESYPTRVVKRGATVRPLPVASAQLRPRITWRGTTYEDVNAFMQVARFSGLLVIHDGEIVLERYAFDRKPEDRWTSFSVAKSVTAILLGAAIQDGYIESLDEPVTKYVPQLAGSGYDGVNIRQLITMTSGVKWNEDYADPNSDVARASSWPGEPGMNPLVSYMRRLPSEAEPGTKFVYKTGETDMAGLLVANAVGKGLAEYLSEKIWQPYGMERDAIWMVDRGGAERGGCCMSMTLRDYGRFGLFMLEGGKAGEKQVIPEWYLHEATTNQIKPPAEGSYGYFWWIHDDGYAAYGIFGQQIRISPQEKLIVVLNGAFPTADDDDLSQAEEAVWQGVREALKTQHGS